MSNKSRNFICTHNNPEKPNAHDYLEEIFKRLNATFVIGQLEEGKEGTPHY